MWDNILDMLLCCDVMRYTLREFSCPSFYILRRNNGCIVWIDLITKFMTEPNHILVVYDSNSLSLSLWVHFLFRWDFCYIHVSRILLTVGFLSILLQSLRARGRDHMPFYSGSSYAISSSIPILNPIFKFHTPNSVIYSAKQCKTMFWVTIWVNYWRRS